MRIATIIVLSAGTCFAAEQGRWLDVPFVQQPEDGCGAASIAMVMQYWEQQRREQVTPSSDVAHVQQAIFTEQAKGAYASAVERYLQNHGYATYVVHGDKALLEHHIARGRPLIVALKPSSSPRLHYVVVAGFDPGQHLLLINDPAQRKLLKVNSSDFDQEWKATGNWTLLALPRSGAQ